MREIAQWLQASETAQLIYIIVLLAVVVLPMIGLTIWYHGNIGKTDGGKTLMKKQNSAEYRPGHGSLIITRYKYLPIPALLAFVIRNFQNAEKLHTAIMSDEHGQHAKAMQIQTYKVCAGWLVAVVIVGAIPFIVQHLAL